MYLLEPVNNPLELLITSNNCFQPLRTNYNLQEPVNILQELVNNLQELVKTLQELVSASRNRLKPKRTY